jgi:hypothetical protein
MSRSISTLKEPEQLIFDFFIEQDEEDQKYSQSIELYDAIPKYYWGKQQRDDRGGLPILKRVFKHKNLEYEVQIRPARLIIKGEEKHFYPGVREELVEDALRKIATEGRVRKVENLYGLEFSLHELKKELDRTGHNYSKVQIKEALTICNGTGITLICKSGGNSIEMMETLFPSLILVSREKWIESKQRAVVRFNTLVTRSIEQRSFRQINYERSMKLASSLARWIHKRMSHNYRQAQSFQNTYTIHLSTIIRDSGIVAYKRKSDSKKYVLKVLAELVKEDVIYKFDEENIKKGRLLVDVKFILNPTMIFSGEMKRANALAKAIK